MHSVHRLVPGLVAGALLFGSGSATLAAKNKPQTKLVAVAGQVSNLTTQGFTLTAATKKGTTSAAKTVQVSIDAKTKVKARKGTTGPLTSGDYVVVVGAKTTSGVTARRILYSATPFKTGRAVRKARSHFLHRAAGSVNLTASTPSQLVITTKAGKTLTFVINSQTKFRVNKVTGALAPTFTNGERVRVLFTRDAKLKVLTATLVVVLPTK